MLTNEPGRFGGGPKLIRCASAIGGELLALDAVYDNHGSGSASVVVVAFRLCAADIDLHASGVIFGGLLESTGPAALSDALAGPAADSAPELWRLAGGPVRPGGGAFRGCGPGRSAVGGTVLVRQHIPVGVTSPQTMFA